MKLALLGGKPLNKKPFPKYPVFTADEIKAVVAVIKKGELSSQERGEECEKFEREFARYHQTEEAIVVNSGMAALQAALAAIQIGPGDEVIVPPYTFWATATSVLTCNAIPIFADIDPLTLTINPGEIRKKINARTRAIIPVHLNGHPANMDEIMAIAKEHGLVIIEDCAQAHGARYKGRLVGTIGHMGAFSFNQKKNLSTGEGGMLLTDDEKFAKNARSFRSHGISENLPIAVSLGGMYRMTELEAAIGIVQLRKLDENNDIRTENADYLSQQLEELPGIEAPYVGDTVKHVYYNYSPTFVEQEMGIPRNKFIQAVQAEGVPLTEGVYPEPIYNYPLFRRQLVHRVGCPFSCPFYKIPERRKDSMYEDEHCPVAEERIYRTNLELKIHPPRTEEHMQIIVGAFRKVIENLEQLKR